VEAALPSLGEAQQRSPTLVNTGAAQYQRRHRYPIGMLAGSTGALCEVGALREIDDLEMRFNALSADNERLLELWAEMDLNSNGELGFSEVITFMKQHYPILANKETLSHAFLASSDTEDQTGCKVVHPEHFRVFLLNVFRFAKRVSHRDLHDVHPLPPLEELKDLEMQIDAMCADNTHLLQLWAAIDSNSNGELGFHEVATYMSTNHMILTNIPVLKAAFQHSPDQDAETGCKVIKPEHFRPFLSNIFRSAEEFFQTHVQTLTFA